MIADKIKDAKFLQIDYNPFEGACEIEKIVSMNEPQRLMWLSCIIGGDGASLAYNESLSLDFKGEFNLDAFSEAVTEVVQRHEALRSVVSANGESIIIYKNTPFKLSYQDISSFSEPELMIKNFVSVEMKNVFDLQEGPLFRAFIHKINDEHHYFTIVGHHMVCDGWSFGIILENIAKLYNAKINGAPITLEKADQISEYAVEMAAFKHSEDHGKVKDYWLDLYKDGAPIVDFVTDYPRPLNRNYKSYRVDNQVSMELVEKLKKLGAKNGSSLVNTLLSAFEIFIFLKTNQYDLIVGMPTAGQAATEKFELVGHCVNLLALRSKIDPEMSFSDYLVKRKKDFFDAFENQKFTLGELVHSLEQRTDYSRIPILPILFNVDMGIDTAVSFKNLEYELISNPKFFETFEIFLNVTGSRSSFLLEWSYNTQLFKVETIQEISKEFENLLETLTIDPAVSLSTLKKRNSAYWKNEHAKWNTTEVNYPKEKNLFNIVEIIANKNPNKTAVTVASDKITYRKLIDQASKIANFLNIKGISIGDVVAVAMEQSPEMVIALLGILKSGATYLIIDTKCPTQRIEFMLSDAEAKFIFVSKEKSKSYKSNAVEIIIEDVFTNAEFKDSQPAFPVIKGDNFAYLQYISHHGGKPVAVKVKHFNLINLLTSLQNKPGIRENDKLLSISSTSCEVLVAEIFVALISGAEIILSHEHFIQSPECVLKLVQDENINVLSGTPSDWKKLMPFHSFAKADLRLWNFGEILTKELADDLLPRLGELWNLYGHAESTIVSTIREILVEDEGINIGWPIQNTQIYICDEHGKLAPHGKTGEICIAGDGIIDGYLKLSDGSFFELETDEDSYKRVYKTGDLGRFSANGDLQYLGSLENKVKIKGIRVFLKEIELVLAEQQNVKEAIVICKDDKAGDAHLIAYLLNNQLVEDDETLIKEWEEKLRLKLPELMIPESFVMMEKFPLTARNEIDKQSLPKPKVKINQHEQIDPIQLENEQLITSIWSDILGIKEIDRTDDFFEIGGNSMFAVKMMAEIEKKTGQRFPLATLLKNSTVSKLARRIQSDDQGESLETLIPIRTKGNKTPIYLIHGAGLNVLLFNSITKFLDEDQPVYGVQGFGLNADMEIPSTMEEIAKKHLEELLKSDPVGPYAFAGYSLGGYIAFEMSKQLIALGKTVSFLGIIDTYAYNQHRISNEKFRYFKKLKRQFYKAPYFTRSFLNSPGETINYQLLTFKNKILSVTSPEKVIKQTIATDRESEIYKVYANAYETYDLKKVDVKISLFKVEKRLYYLDDMEYLGWRGLSTQDIDIHIVPGDHKTMLHPPNDEKFARILQESLDQASK